MKLHIRWMYASRAKNVNLVLVNSAFLDHMLVNVLKDHARSNIYFKLSINGHIGHNG